MSVHWIQTFLKAILNEFSEFSSFLVNIMGNILPKFPPQNGHFDERNGRALPPELVYEMFAFLPLDNSIGILVNVPNAQILQINGPRIRRQLNWLKNAIQNNKWNEHDCGRILIIGEDGLTVTHPGPDNHWQIVRAKVPIRFSKCEMLRKPKIVGYFEVQILGEFRQTFIGFCDGQFELEGKWIGDFNNSIGIWHKRGIAVDGNFMAFKNSKGGYFHCGDVVGIGLINLPPNSSMECFGTWNGTFLGSIKLPPKFMQLKLFPAINLRLRNETIRANFGKNKFLYNQNQQRAKRSKKRSKCNKNGCQNSFKIFLLKYLLIIF